MITFLAALVLAFTLSIIILYGWLFAVGIFNHFFRRHS